MRLSDILEAFDRPVPWRWYNKKIAQRMMDGEMRPVQNYDAEFTVNGLDGEPKEFWVNIDVWISPQDERKRMHVMLINHSSERGLNLTGGNNIPAFQVYATAVNIIQTVIDDENPEKVLFVAMDPRTTPIYEKLVMRFAGDRYLASQDHDKFVLTRKAA